MRGWEEGTVIDGGGVQIFSGTNTSSLYGYFASCRPLAYAVANIFPQLSQLYTVIINQCREYCSNNT